MKGISPLIAAVLLIAFVVGLATIIMGWMGTYTRETTQTIENRTGVAIDCSVAAITIEDVYVSGSEAKAVVKNSGYADNLIITSAQLYNTTGHNFTGTGLDSDFDKGEINTISFNGAGISCTSFSKVIVTTNCGGISDTFDGTPKGC